MGNIESCCAYGAPPRVDNHRTPKLKPGGAYNRSRANGHYAHQQLRNDFDGVSPDPGGLKGGPPRSEESCGNLQHISEREPDDWEEDPSLHPTRETLFMEKTKKSIQSKKILNVKVFCERSRECKRWEKEGNLWKKRVQIFKHHLD